MPRAFDALWEGDTEHGHLIANLDKVDCTELVRVLDDCLEAITRFAFTPSEWAQFKGVLIKIEAGWGVNVFRWTSRVSRKARLDVDYSALRAIYGTRLWRRAIFVLWMALQDPGLPVSWLLIPSIWDLIDSRPTAMLEAC